MKTSFSIRIAFFFILSFLAVSCHRDTDALNMTFSKVEKCMDLCPDSALNLLKGIHDPEKLWGESQATYALLMTQAMDKNYMKFSSDSLIALALNYYTITQTSPIMYAKALFYHGRVMLELDKEEEALKSFLAAKDVYERTKDHKMLALIAEEVGMINRKQDLYDDALVSMILSILLLLISGTMTSFVAILLDDIENTTSLEFIRLSSSDDFIILANSFTSRISPSLYTPSGVGIVTTL